MYSHQGLLCSVYYLGVISVCAHCSPLFFFIIYNNYNLVDTSLFRLFIYRNIDVPMLPVHRNIFVFAHPLVYYTILHTINNIPTVSGRLIVLARHRGKSYRGRDDFSLIKKNDSSKIMDACIRIRSTRSVCRWIPAHTSTETIIPFSISSSTIFLDRWS